jgi:hypothetical protein
LRLTRNQSLSLAVSKACCRVARLLLAENSATVLLVLLGMSAAPAPVARASPDATTRPRAPHLILSSVVAGGAPETGAPGRWCAVEIILRMVVVLRAAALGGAAG